MAEGENGAAKKADRYEGLKPEIAEKLKRYENDYFRWDKPVPFCGLMVYPAKITEYEVFSSCSSVFTINRKDDHIGITMTNLDYLNYKMQNKKDEKSKEEAAILSYSFQKICEIIFHIKNGLKCQKCGHVMSYDSKEFSQYLSDLQDMAVKIQKGDTEDAVAPQLKCPSCEEEKFTEMIKIIVDPNTKKSSLLIDGHIITSRDFDLLRQIVLYQNFPDYADDS